MDVLKRALAVSASLIGCVPELDSDESTVQAPRVLAIVAEPAEVAPGPSQRVRYRALVADANGVRADASVRWFHCLAQKPLAELGPISPACLNAASGQLSVLGEGNMVEATLPNNACALFGPNPPPPVEGQPPGRPVDPDESGGYKLPVVVGFNAGAGDAVALYEQRISCGLAGVSPAISLAFALGYHRNENPSVRELRVARASGAVEVLAESQPLEVTAGERVELELVWPECPSVDACGDGVCGPDETRQTCADECNQPRGCGGQERYLDFDRERQELFVRREALRVAWYATSGRYDEERTGVAAELPATASRNGWMAPVQAGSVNLWAVLRDSRGGVGVRQTPVVVR